MAFHSLHLRLFLVVVHPLLALQVAPNSPCSTKCIDSSILDASDSASSTTRPADIVCQDSELSSTAMGVKWTECMSCLQNSTYTQENESDQGWFLYNLRYSFDSCIYAYPNGTGSGSNPCETSTACGNLQAALEFDNLSASSSNPSDFGYCDADGGSGMGPYYQSCLNCVSANGDTGYIANSLVALEAGCAQRPNATDLVGLNDSVFSKTLISIVDHSKLNNSSSSATLSTAALAGIVAGGALVLLIVAAIIIVRCRRRKNRDKLGMGPRWGKDKRRSSISFKCRNILASPLSPKFSRDLPPVEEHHQPYGSLEQQMAGISSINRGPDGRYYIESKSRTQTYPYESSLDGRRTRDTASSFQSTLVAEQQDDLHFPKRQGMARMTIGTTEAGLSPPPAVHHSPKSNQFSISPCATHPTPAINTTIYNPATFTPTTASPTGHSFIRSSSKPRKTTTMSSQGSGYPSTSRKSPLQSPQVQQHGWPSARSPQEPWFPPPPPGSGPSPSSKYGRKVSLGAVGAAARRWRRGSGSPVETRQVRVAFPGPPQR